MHAIFKKLTGARSAQVEQPQPPAEQAQPTVQRTSLNKEERKAKQQLETLRMKQRQAEVLRAIPGLHWLAAVLLVVTLGATVLTANKLKSVVGMAKTNEASDIQATIRLDKTPLTEAEYANITQWYARIHPNVAFHFDKRTNALRISTPNAEHHADWLYALAALQARDDSVLWESDLFCVGRCDGAAAAAAIKGYRQRVAVN